MSGMLKEIAVVHLDASYLSPTLCLIMASGPQFPHMHKEGMHLDNL